MASKTKIEHPRKAAKLRKMGIPAQLAEVLVRDGLSTDEVAEAAGFVFMTPDFKNARKLPKDDLAVRREAAARRLANSLMALVNNLK